MPKNTKKRSSSAGYENPAYELDEVKQNNQRQQLRGIADDVSNVKDKIEKWKRFVCRKRKSLRDQDVKGGDNRGGIGLGDVAEDFEFKGLEDTSVNRQMVIGSNRLLIQYFDKLGKEKNDASLDLEYILNLIKNGAQIDCHDRYGQTILHEVARAWHIDVAQFLIEQGADINKADKYGRTPLHVAAATDYPEMVNFLLDNGANPEAVTTEKQTAVHFAARTDSCSSLKVLIARGLSYKTVRDYKGRTPLQVAAELDRSETARILIENDAPVGVKDKSGQTAIVLMITKMPPVAQDALSQLHRKNRTDRKQFFYLNWLEEQELTGHVDSAATGALNSIVHIRNYDLITHPVVKRFIDTKWRKYAKYGAWMNLGFNLAFILTWTVIAVMPGKDYKQKATYVFPDDGWLVFLWILAVALSAWQIKDELLEYFNSVKTHQRWKEWRESEIRRDLEHSHPRWPDERAFLEKEIEMLDDKKPAYFNDMWNIFDWIVYFFLLICIFSHLIDIFVDSDTLARLHVRVMACTIIFIWIRLMKNLRAFSLIGPFIVILGSMIADIIKFLFVYILFYIPFACAFWIIFGGEKEAWDYDNSGSGLETISRNITVNNRTVVTNHTVPVKLTVTGFRTVNDMLFTLFRLTLVDEYAYDEMREVDMVMTDMLVGLWLGISAIVLLNLFIALLSDTFQRVYDNAQANAVMQKAMTILSVQDGMLRKWDIKIRRYILEQCAPMEDFYDDDIVDAGVEDLKKVTIQIKEVVDEIQEDIKHMSGHRALDDAADNMSILSGEVQKSQRGSELEQIREQIRSVRDAQDEMADRFWRTLQGIEQSLEQLGAVSAGTAQQQVERRTRSGDDGTPERPRRRRRSSKRKERVYEEEDEERRSSKNVRRRKQMIEVEPRPLLGTYMSQSSQGTQQVRSGNVIEISTPQAPPQRLLSEEQPFGGVQVQVLPQRPYAPRGAWQGDDSQA